MAFGLFAEVTLQNGSALEWVTEDEAFDEITSGNFWGETTGLTAKSFNGDLPASRSWPFGDTYRVEQVYYANVKTTLGNPVIRYAQAGGAVLTVDKEDNKEYYFDGHVRFTVFDEAPSFAAYLADNAKIALYLQEENADTATAATNLYVWVGGATPIKYGAVPFEVEDWAHLTIKMVPAANEKIGFVIFVNGTALTGGNAAADDVAGTDANLNAAKAYQALGQLFISAATTDTNKIKYVGFDGQGDIEEIIFTDHEYAKSPSLYNVDFSAVKNIIGTYSLTTNDVPVTEGIDDGKISFVFTGTAPEVKLTWLGDAEHCAGEKAGDANGLTVATGDVDAAVAMFDTTKYAALQDAIDFANTNEVGAGTVKLLVDNAAQATILLSKVGTTLDLNGRALAEQKPMTIQATGAITITGNGSVAGIVTAAAATVESGTFAGQVTVGTINGGTFNGLATAMTTINGGSFLVSVNNLDALNGKAKLGFKFKANSGYYVLDRVYEVNTATVEGGTISVDKNPAFEGDTVTITTTPTAGYKLVAGSVKVNDGAVPVTDDTTFTMPAAAATVTATFEQESTDVTVTLTKGTGIASISPTSVTDKPGESYTVTLTPASTIKIPVFKAGDAVCGSTYMGVIPDKDTEITFTATEASGGSEQEAAAALVNLGMNANKLAALQALNIPATSIAAWAANQATPAEAVKGDFVGASVELDVAPITNATKIEVSEITKVEGGAMTFKVAIEDVEVAKAAIAKMVKASANVDTWVDITIEASFDDKTNEIVVTPADTTLTKAFMKVVIPADPTVAD